MEQKLIIQGRLPGRNEEISSFRRHWTKGAKLKRDATEKVFYACIDQNLKTINNSTAELDITFFEPNKRRDIDNVMSSTKYILDGLVKARILFDDSPSFVRKINCDVQYDVLNPRVEVKLIYGKSL